MKYLERADAEKQLQRTLLSTGLPKKGHVSRAVSGGKDQLA